MRLDIATLAALRLRRIAGLRRRIAGLGLRLAVARLKLHRRCRGDARLGGRRHTGPGLHAALQLPQPILELAIAILQFLVLAGELAKLLFQLLDAQLRIRIIRLRQRRRRQGDQRDDRGCDCKLLKSG